jgi:hypothetical protein
MECRSHPCHPACPNADEPPVAFKCDCCGDGIRAGEKYFVVGGCDRFCKDCVWETEADEDDLDDGDNVARDAYLYGLRGRDTE